mgnify:CR=1 FL=1
MAELEKALLKAPRPSVFFETLRQMEQLGAWFPEVQALIGVPQDIGGQLGRRQLKAAGFYPQIRAQSENMETLLALDARWYVPAHHGVCSGEEFADFARQMLLLAQAAEGAETAAQAQERLSALTGHAPTEEERTGLEEFLAARERGEEK